MRDLCYSIDGNNLDRGTLEHSTPGSNIVSNHFTVTRNLYEVTIIISHTIFSYIFASAIHIHNTTIKVKLFYIWVYLSLP